MTFITYTRSERDAINNAWAKLLAYAEINGNDGVLELSAAVHEHRLKTSQDLIGCRGQLLDLLLRAGDVEPANLFMYMPAARTVIAYSWHQHDRFKSGSSYSHNGVTWDDVLVAASLASTARGEHLQRKARALSGETKA